MEKLGVEYDQDKVKEAGEGGNKNACPVCGRDSGESKNCPEHGTEPFEKKQQVHGVRSGRLSTQAPNLANPPRMEKQADDDLSEFWNI